MYEELSRLYCRDFPRQFCEIFIQNLLTNVIQNIAKIFKQNLVEFFCGENLNVTKNILHSSIVKKTFGRFGLTVTNLSFLTGVRPHVLNSA